MGLFSRLDHFHKTRRGYFMFGVAELILTYIFASIAIDTASMWAYLATLILLAGTVFNFINVFTSKDAKKGKADAKSRY